MTVGACLVALEAIAAEVRGDLDPRDASFLQVHVLTCARCAAARADALACAPALRALPPAEGPADPVVWERRLFLRLLADQADGRGSRRPAGWARLALRLGRSVAQEVEETWLRWRRGAEAGASR